MLSTVSPIKFFGILSQNLDNQLYQFCIYSRLDNLVTIMVVQYSYDKPLSALINFYILFCSIPCLQFKKFDHVLYNLSLGSEVCFRLLYRLPGDCS